LCPRAQVHARAHASICTRRRLSWPDEHTQPPHASSLAAGVLAPCRGSQLVHRAREAGGGPVRGIESGCAAVHCKKRCVVAGLRQALRVVEEHSLRHAATLLCTCTRCLVLVASLEWLVRARPCLGHWDL